MVMKPTVFVRWPDGERLSAPVSRSPGGPVFGLPPQIVNATMKFVAVVRAFRGQTTF